MYFLPSPRIIHSSKSPVSFYWIMILDTNFEVTSVIIATGGSVIDSRPSQLTEEGNICMYTNMNIQISMTISICNYLYIKMSSY